MRSAFVLFLLAAMAAASTIRHHYRPHYLECIDSSECGPHECCLFLGKGKFSIPKCKPILELWANCDSKQTAKGSNHSANYPDKTVVEYTHIFYEMCPCERGLECDKMTNVCIDPIDTNFNDIGMK